MTALLQVFRGSHVRLWLAGVLAIAVIGTAGYLAMGWPIGDAAYMTGITLTTVGYKEVNYFEWRQRKTLKIDDVLANLRKHEAAGKAG